MGIQMTRLAFLRTFSQYNNWKSCRSTPTDPNKDVAHLHPGIWHGTSYTPYFERKFNGQKKTCEISSYLNPNSSDSLFSSPSPVLHSHKRRIGAHRSRESGACHNPLSSNLSVFQPLTCHCEPIFKPIMGNLCTKARSSAPRGEHDSLIDRIKSKIPST